jgi:hypothetical protein
MGNNVWSQVQSGLGTKTYEYFDWLTVSRNVTLLYSTTAGIQRQRLGLAIGPNYVGSTWRWGQNQVSEMLCFK